MYEQEERNTPVAKHMVWRRATRDVFGMFGRSSAADPIIIQKRGKDDPGWYLDDAQSDYYL